MNTLERRIKQEKVEQNRFVFVRNSDECYEGPAAECKMAVQIMEQMKIPLSDIRLGPPINPETLSPDPSIRATQTGIYVRDYPGGVIHLGDAMDEYNVIEKRRIVLNPDYEGLIKKSGE